MPKAQTRALGANEQRDRIVAKIKREIKSVSERRTAYDKGAWDSLTYLLRWIEESAERYNARPGGLGRTKKKPSKDKAKK